jgi:3-phosphoshikimate 1-carboxyvinyltransferase
MANARINPGKLQGEIVIPGSKSHTIRALLFALMAKGKSKIHNPLPAPDSFAMLDAIRTLGAKVDMENNTTLIVEGVAGKLHPAEDVIQCANSGQVIRYVGAMAALASSYTILTGDLSIRHNRPLLPLLDGLEQLGAFAASSRLDGFAPIIVKGPTKGGKAKIAGEDSQPVSALLMLGAFVPLELQVTNPGEKASVGLTLNWFDRLGISYENKNFEHYKMKGKGQLKEFEYSVPGDFGSAAFQLGAAIVTHSEVTLHNVDMKDVQSNKAIIPALESMGAQFESHGSKLHVKKTQSLKGTRIDVSDFTDALPILAVIGCFASGKTEIVNGAMARQKESDRIHCIATELKKMGADIEEKPDGLIIKPARLHGAHDLQSHQDHRIAMALSVAALGAHGGSVIHGIDCVAKSYPTFFQDLFHMGAALEVK